MEANLSTAISNITDALTLLNGATDGISAGDANYQSQIAALKGVTVFGDLELTPWTVAGGSVANSAGNTSVAADAQGIPTDKCAFLQVIPNGLAYANKYWYKPRAGDASKTTYKYECRLMLPTTTDCAASQAVELDIEHRISQQVFNTGLQFDFAQNQVRIWNRSSVPVHGWIPTALPCPRWNPAEWHSVTLETHRDANNVYYDAVTIDGVRTTLTASFPTIQLAEADCMNNALQLDANSAGAPYQMYIDAIRLTVS